MVEKQILTVTRRLSFALSQIMSILTYKKFYQYQVNRATSFYVNISQHGLIFTLRQSIIKSIDVQNILNSTSKKKTLFSTLHIFFHAISVAVILKIERIDHIFTFCISHLIKII